MSEITKLYDNAKIAPKKCSECDNNMDCGFGKDCYIPFTAEKQISLIRFLMEQEDFSWAIAQQGKDTEYIFYVGYEYSSGDFKEFTEAIVGIINDIWQDLTEKEKETIRGILGA